MKSGSPPTLWTLVVVAEACGRSASQETESDEPISTKVVVKAIKVTSEGDQVESITVLIDDWNEVTMPLADGIDPAMWGPRHLQSHIQLGKTLGFKIGIKYIQTPDGGVVIELIE